MNTSLFIGNSIKPFISSFDIIDPPKKYLSEIMKDYHFLNSTTIRHTISSFFALVVLIVIIILILRLLKFTPLDSKLLKFKPVSLLLEFLLIGKNQQDEIETPKGKKINYLKPEYRRFLISYILFTVAIFILPYGLFATSNVINLNKVLLMLVISQFFAIISLHFLIGKEYKKFILSIIGGILVAFIVCFLCANYIGYPVTKIISSSLISKGDYKIQVIQILSTMVLGLLIFIMLIPFLYALYDYFYQTKWRCVNGSFSTLNKFNSIIVIIVSYLVIVMSVFYTITRTFNINVVNIIVISIVIGIILYIPLIQFIFSIKDSFKDSFLSIFISSFYFIFILLSFYLLLQSSTTCKIEFVYKNFFDLFKFFNQLFMYLLFSGIVAFAVSNLNFFNSNRNRDKGDINIVSIMFKSFPVLGTLYLAFVLYFLPLISKVNKFPIWVQLLISVLFILSLFIFGLEVSIFVVGFVRFLFSPFYKMLDTVREKPFNYNTLDSWRWMVNFIKNEEIVSRVGSYSKSMLDTFYNNFELVKPDFRCKETIVSLTKVLEGFNEILYNNKNSKNADKFARYAYEVIFEKFIKKNTSDKALIQYFIRVFISYLKNGEKDKEIEVYERKSFWEWVYYPDNKSDLSYIEEFKEEFVKFMKKICDFNKENESEVEGLFNKTIEEYERSEGIPEGIKTAIENVKNEIFGSSRGILYYW